jgi:hypothetical protein
MYAFHDANNIFTFCGGSIFVREIVKQNGKLLPQHERIHNMRD